jgi:aminoglycoside/choline kinase family phosphotransferase
MSGGLETGLETDSSATDSLQRAQTLQNWFHSLLAELSPEAKAADFNFSLVQGDASFRRYFRVQSSKQSYILVDAPPDKEDSRKFVTIASLFKAQGVQVPTVHKVDYEQGFICQADFGDTLLWSPLKQAQTAARTEDATRLYHQAFEQLLSIQQVSTAKLPLFSAELLQQEMELFRHWFCEGILKLTLSDKDNAVLSQAFDFLMQAALSQEQLCVHRDYHSRNLLCLDLEENASIGVIDFQDAVCGPCSYDLVSLLKDCYIDWPLAQVKTWALEYRKLAGQQKLINVEEDKFLRDFDLMGAQRHLKAIGIFSRLCLRDQKITYLTDIPRTLNYLHQVSAEYSELNDLQVWLEVNVLPEAEKRILSFAKIGTSVGKDNP